MTIQTDIKRLEVMVGKVDGTGKIHRFATPKDASEFIGSVIAMEDPNGVARGDYYIDAPEEWVNL